MVLAAFVGLPALTRLVGRLIDVLSGFALLLRKWTAFGLVVSSMFMLSHFLSKRLHVEVVHLRRFAIGRSSCFPRDIAQYRALWSYNSISDKKPLASCTLLRTGT